MKKAILFFFISLLFVLASHNNGQSSELYTKGHITVNNNKLHIKDSAAYWDRDNRLLIFFYPYKLTEEDITKMDSGYMTDFVANDKQNPDPLKWNYCPYGMLEISFPQTVKEKLLESVNGIILSFFGFKTNYVTIGICRYAEEARNSLDVFEIGDNEVSAFVKISTKGDEKTDNNISSWDLITQTRIFSIKP